ncbi:heat shock factor binding protein 1-domain-containing protein [Infundibulicybe gibba]|nr:heat shock factor binding protein 1-domain-containing protein [Infundibulicybe gibba]
MSPSSALPLNLTPATPVRSAESGKDKSPTSSVKQQTKVAANIIPTDISSPHELTAFVETLLEQLDAKFDDMSSQILDRMTQMSTRVDSLEASIQDIINGDIGVPQSPSPVPATPGLRRSDTGLQ